RQATDADAEAASVDMARSIDDISGPAVLIMAGDCFDLLTEGHLDPTPVLSAHGRLSSALAAFAEGEGRHLVVIPGNRDHCLAWHKPAVNTLKKRLHAEITFTVDLTITTGGGEKRVRVEHGNRFDPANAFD